MRRLPLTVMAIACLSSAVGCGAGFSSRRKGDDFVPATTQDPISRGGDAMPFALAVPEDAIVRVVGPNTTCTGTIIEEDLVLTAHHCIVDRGSKGEFTKRTLESDQLKVELGGDYFAWAEVGVRHVVVPPCGEAGGGGDIAVLVLTRKLVGLSTMQPRTDAPPNVGEELSPVGFGRCALSSDGIRRNNREGGRIRALTSETIHLDASICPGDSGGPVFAKGSREIVGVISMSNMDHDDKTRGASVMARLDAYRLVFAHARLVADGLSPQELPPLECSK